MHLGHHAPHQRLGTQGPGHDAGAQGRQVVVCKIRALELGDEHRRHAVERGAALAVHRLENLLRVERDHRTQAGAVGERAEHADHAAEAMKQRHAEAQAIGGRVAEHPAERFAVVDDVAAGEHDALGKTGRSRRVLHVDHVVDADRRFAFIQRGLSHAGGARAQLGVWCDICRTRIADEEDALHMIGLRFTKFRHVIDALESCHREERRRFTLAQQVFDLARAKRGVDRH